jgi:hypothetical protein
MGVKGGALLGVRGHRRGLFTARDSAGKVGDVADDAEEEAAEGVEVAGEG